jgi:flagellar hook-associated protein 1 FlgK
MGSLSANFDIATRSMQAFQAAIQTISHNISNVNTPGYSRERVEFSPEYPDLQGGFYVGRGVRVDGVVRLQDEFLERQWWREAAGQGQSAAMERAYALAEDVLQEPGEGGLNELMTAFRSDWQNLANNPEDAGVRAVLQTDGKALARAFNSTRADLIELRRQTDAELRAEIPQINAKADEIAALNKQIKQAILRGLSPNDALDRRDALTEDLAQLAPLQVIDRADGGRAIYLDGAPLVEEPGAAHLVVVDKPGDPPGLAELRWKEFDQEVTVGGGRLQGLLDARDELYPDLMTQLDTLASTFFASINDLHRTGVGLDGTVEVLGARNMTAPLAADADIALNGTTIALAAGDDLATIVGKINAQEATTGIHAVARGARLVLAPGGASPQTVRVTGDPDGALAGLGIVNDFFAGEPGAWALSDAVAADPRHIAASATGAPGDNTLARGIAALWNARTLDGGTRTFDEFHQGFLATTGARSAAATRARENQDVLLEQVDNLRQSVSGVSLDEELTDLIKFQRSYEMAARSIQTTNEMMETLLNMVN